MSKVVHGSASPRHDSRKIARRRFTFAEKAAVLDILHGGVSVAAVARHFGRRQSNIYRLKRSDKMRREIEQHAAFEIHDSDGTFMKVEDEGFNELPEPCAITFPKIKEEIKWDPEELEEFASSYPGFGDGWTETTQSELSRSSLQKPPDDSIDMVDLTQDEPMCNTTTEIRAKPACTTPEVQNNAATAYSKPRKMCKSVPCSERKDCSVIDSNSSSRKTEQETFCCSSRKDKSKKKFKNDACKKCSRSVKMGGSGNKKRLVAQEIARPEKKSCSCALEVETCALHPDRKKHFCSLCGAMFLWKEYLDMHMQSHTAEMPYSCSVCSAKFYLKESLDKHVRFHPGCSSPSCKANIKSKRPSDTPTKAHGLSAAFGCAICNLTFLWQEQLRNHLVAHPGRKLFFCAICGPRFPLEDELFLHVAGHSESGQFMCTVCNAVLTSQTHLDSHMSSHFDQNVFPCSLCKLPFASSKLLECHMALFHKESEQHLCSSLSKEKPTSTVICDSKGLPGCRSLSKEQPTSTVICDSKGLPGCRSLSKEQPTSTVICDSKGLPGCRSLSKEQPTSTVICDSKGLPGCRSLSKEQPTSTVICDSKGLPDCRREGSAAAQQEQGLPVCKASPQEDKNLRVHMVNGITVFKDFFPLRTRIAKTPIYQSYVRKSGILLLVLVKGKTLMRWTSILKCQCKRKNCVVICVMPSSSRNVV